MTNIKRVNDPSIGQPSGVSNTTIASAPSLSNPPEVDSRHAEKPKTRSTSSQLRALFHFPSIRNPSPSPDKSTNSDLEENEEIGWTVLSRKEEKEDSWELVDPQGSNDSIGSRETEEEVSAEEKEEVSAEEKSVTVGEENLFGLKWRTLKGNSQEEKRQFLSEFREIVLTRCNEDDKKNLENKVESLLKESILAAGIGKSSSDHRNTLKVNLENLIKEFQETPNGLVILYDTLKNSSLTKMEIDPNVMNKILNLPLSAERGFEGGKELVALLVEDILNVINDSNSARDILKKTQGKTQELAKEAISFKN
jgi:hypothetical protein